MHLEPWMLILLLIKYKKEILYFLLLSVSLFNNTELCIGKMAFPLYLNCIIYAVTKHIFSAPP